MEILDKEYPGFSQLSYAEKVVTLVTGRREKYPEKVLPPSRTVRLNPVHPAINRKRVEEAMRPYGAVETIEFSTRFRVTRGGVWRVDPGDAPLEGNKNAPST